jgi:PAS domain S-box-containing protein
VEPAHLAAGEIPSELGRHSPRRRGLLSALVAVSLSRLAREAGRAERKASQSEERFANAFDHAPVGMALLDRDSRHVRVNDALATMLGRTREELTGLSADRIMPPDDAAACRALVAALIRGDQDRLQRRHEPADRRRAPRARAVHMTLVDGTGEGDAPVLVHAVDVTEQRPRRAPHAPPRRSRPLDRPAEPPRFRGRDADPDRAEPPLPHRRARCWSSTSTASRRSTTRTATMPATSCSSGSPTSCAPACA